VGWGVTCVFLRVGVLISYLVGWLMVTFVVYYYCYTWLLLGVGCYCWFAWGLLLFVMVGVGYWAGVWCVVWLGLDLVVFNSNWWYLSDNCWFVWAVACLGFGSAYYINYGVCDYILLLAYVYRCGSKRRLTMI